MNICTRFAAALAAVLVTTTLPVVAQNIYIAPFAFEKRDAAKNVDQA